ncbi:hypothetical protein [Companilactobacillus sp. HBUAS59544]|uniref:hypothetical protein n=1 Tax=Companilactobacillus sp. HBUAS59544 TaxID=3109363 RepID=UPI002FF08238
MTDSIEFGNRINRRPLIVSFFLSLIVGSFFGTINFKLALAVFFVILGLMLLWYYPANLKTLFGHWQVEKHGISYYKMHSYRDRLKMVLLPDKTDFQFISFSQVHKYHVVEGNHQYTSADILTINPAKQSLLPWKRKAFFLELEIKNGTIDLDLSSSQRSDPNTLYRLSNVLKIIDSKIN